MSKTLFSLTGLTISICAIFFYFVVNDEDAGVFMAVSGMMFSIGSLLINEE